MHMHVCPCFHIKDLSRSVNWVPSHQDPCKTLLQHLLLLMVSLSPKAIPSFLISEWSVHVLFSRPDTFTWLPRFLRFWLHVRTPFHLTSYRHSELMRIHPLSLRVWHETISTITAYRHHHCKWFPHIWVFLWPGQAQHTFQSLCQHHLLDPQLPGSQDVSFLPFGSQSIPLDTCSVSLDLL